MGKWCSWYDAADIAAAMRIRNGALSVWTNDRLVTTPLQRRIVDVWVRLSVTRGRLIDLFPASELDVSRVADAPATYEVSTSGGI